MLVGCRKQWEFLKKSTFCQKLSHGYLFSGPEGVGKKSTALEFTKFLHCQDKDVRKRPCGLCPGCRAVSRGVHPDALFLTPEPEKKEIQISQIRDLIYKLSLKPFLSSYKTAIIDQAHLMNEASQNCLLKVLEEPKGKTILILVTCHPEVLAETIRSRIQEVKFFPVSKIEVLRFLESRGLPERKAQEIARISLGRIGRAVEFLENPEKLQKEKEWISELSCVLKSDIEARFQHARKIAKESPTKILTVWTRCLREVLLFKIGVQKQSNFLTDFLSLSLLKIKRAIEDLERINFLISTKNINKRLALEILMLNL